jgi:hypothetical protein
MWLVDNEANHHMISKRGDFFKYRALRDELWVKGVNVFVAGTCSARTIVEAADDAKIPAVLRNC